MPRHRIAVCQNLYEGLTFWAPWRVEATKSTTSLYRIMEANGIGRRRTISGAFPICPEVSQATH